MTGYSPILKIGMKFIWQLIESPKQHFLLDVDFLYSCPGGYNQKAKPKVKPKPKAMFENDRIFSNSKDRD